MKDNKIGYLEEGGGLRKFQDGSWDSQVVEFLYFHTYVWSEVGSLNVVRMRHLLELSCDCQSETAEGDKVDKRKRWI